jgi:hypothetical protein
MPEHEIPHLVEAEDGRTICECAADCCFDVTTDECTCPSCEHDNPIH